ncbi:MAG: hypothetical protein M3Y04_02530 [Actinomycetota bacterium]|nr:hypothetical protein [Actinomycetota bacterium]
MRFRLGMITGFAAGYYMGTKAGRQRYDQINRGLTRLRRSDTFETATDRAKTLVEDGVDKARALVDARAGAGPDGVIGNGQHGPGGASSSESGLIIPGQAEPPV